MKTKHGHEIIDADNGMCVYRCEKGDDNYSIDSGHAAAPCEGCGVILDLYWLVYLDEKPAPAEKPEPEVKP